MKNISDRKNTLFAIMLVIIICLSFPVEAQTNVAESMTEFLFPEFSKSEVIMKNGRIESMMLNFNLLTEKMLFEADGNFYEILNPGMIDTIILQECKFVSFGDYFYEVLYDAPISLLVSCSTRSPKLIVLISARLNGLRNRHLNGAHLGMEIYIQL